MTNFFYEARHLLWVKAERVFIHTPTLDLYSDGMTIPRSRLERGRRALNRETVCCPSIDLIFLYIQTRSRDPPDLMFITQQAPVASFEPGFGETG